MTVITVKHAGYHVKQLIIILWLPSRQNQSKIMRLLFVPGSEHREGSAWWAPVGRVKKFCIQETALPTVAFRKVSLQLCFQLYFFFFLKVGVKLYYLTSPSHVGFLIWLCSFRSLNVIKDVKNCKLTFWLHPFLNSLAANLWWKALPSASRDSS